VHPVVRADFRRWAQQTDRNVVAVESAILVEAGMKADVDEVWLVHAPENIRLRRAMSRDGSGEEAVRSRMMRQQSDAEYLKQADKVVYNDGIHSLIQQTLGLLSRISDK
jgi:dephospho-CoA kinase